MSNVKLLQKYRTYMVANTGILSGIFGLSGVQGLIFYIIVFFITSFLVGAKVNFEITKYFKDSSVYFSGMGADILVNLAIFWSDFVLAVYYDVGDIS